jgi:DNA-binding Xre family transcriptional regulator
MKNKYIGSNFDDFLKNEHILAETEAVAIKRVLSYQIEKEMKKNKITKVELAKKMKTSRSSLDRLLDPDNASVTLNTLEKTAVILGKKLKIKFA